MLAKAMSWSGCREPARTETALSRVSQNRGAGHSRGQTIDFLLSAKRDAEAVKRFFRKALCIHPPTTAESVRPLSRH
jgi:hypothetical protein